MKNGEIRNICGKKCIENRIYTENKEQNKNNNFRGKENIAKLGNLGQVPEKEDLKVDRDSRTIMVIFGNVRF